MLNATIFEGLLEEEAVTKVKIDLMQKHLEAVKGQTNTIVL